MRKIIFVNKMKNGIEKLHQIASEKNKQGIPIEKLGQTREGAYCLFGDGEYWNVIKANDMARGHRCDMAFFEESIPEEIKGNLINSCCKYCDRENIRTF